MQQSLVENTVAVEVHFTAVGGFDKSIPSPATNFATWPWFSASCGLT